MSCVQIEPGGELRASAFVEICENRTFTKARPVDPLFRGGDDVAV